MGLRQRSGRLMPLAMVIVALGCLSSAAAAQEHVRTVLTIHWGAETFPGTETIDAAIREVLLAPTSVPVNYYAEYLETDEFSLDTASTALRDYIRRKFDGRRIDVVLTNASAALQFALRYRDELFPGIPIAFVSVAIPEVTGNRRPAGVAGVVRDLTFGDTLELALHLHPSTKRVFVIAQAPTVTEYDELVRSQLDRYADRVELTYVKERTVAGLLATVKAIPPGGVILYTRYTPNESVRVMNPDEILRLLADAAPVPIYGVAERYIGTGIVGGMMRDGKITGTALGALAIRILDGTPPESIPIGRMPTVPMFDWRQIQRWRIDPSKLPPESEILFRSPTAWETYKWYIIGTIVVVGAQLLLIAGLLTQHARRRRAETTILQREVTLRSSYQRIRQLAGRLISAQEVTRASIAQELHDDVCQQLSHVSLDIESLKSSSGHLQDAVSQRAMTELSGSTRRALDSIRRLSHDLHPESLRIVGLAPALKAHCIEVASRHNVQVTFTAEEDLGAVPVDLALCLFRIAQESLRNGIEHGHANHLAVSLRRTEANIEMTVTDNGEGFDLDAVSRHSRGLGLVSMEERAHAVGGELHIATGVGRGTTMSVAAPLDFTRRPSAADTARRTPSRRGDRSVAIG